MSEAAKVADSMVEIIKSKGKVYRRELTADGVKTAELLYYKKRLARSRSRFRKLIFYEAM